LDTVIKTQTARHHFGGKKTAASRHGEAVRERKAGLSDYPILSNASDKRYFAETQPLKKVTPLGSAILPKTLILAEKMPNKTAHLR